MKKILFALAAMSTFSFPAPETYGQTLPEAAGAVPAQTPPKSENGEMFNLITLAELTLYKNPGDVSAAAKRLLGKTSLISDEKLQTSVRLALAETVAEPEKFPEIRAKHFKKISERFTEIAIEARQNKNYKTALNAAQFAARADPRNLRARLMLASLVDAYGNDPATAIKLMHAGLKFIDLDAPVTEAYFSKYFSLLSDLQQDFVAADQAQKILKNPNVPAETRKTVALAGAFALYNRGQYGESLELIARERLDENSVQARILRARNLFASGKFDDAVALLDRSIAQFPAEKREPIFNQLSRFYSETGDFDGVLRVSERRLNESPDILAPRIQRLFAYKKLGNAAAFDAELEAVFAQFSMSQAALVALSNFAAEQGMPELALRCMQTARAQNLGTALSVAAVIEALVSANRPAEAIEVYLQSTASDPNVFEDFQTVISAVLASAYVEAAAQESDPEKARALLNHSEILLEQFLENKSASPENRLAVVRHFRSIGRDDIALKIAAAAMKAFPWHSQIRADWLSLQLAVPESFARVDIPAEIRALAQMRRPEPAVWKEILAWLDAPRNFSADDAWSAPAGTNNLSETERAELRALVVPLAK